MVCKNFFIQNAYEQRSPPTDFLTDFGSSVMTFITDSVMEFTGSNRFIIGYEFRLWISSLNLITDFGITDFFIIALIFRWFFVFSVMRFSVIRLWRYFS